MKTTLFAVSTLSLLLAFAIPTARAVECAAGVVRAGCAGPNGAAVTGQNGVHTTKKAPRPGTSATGAQGNTATKAAQPGCAFVNGQRVCR
jgi:hypothetical protein